jgi:GNAT superfamily N-acetyltransferase
MTVKITTANKDLHATQIRELFWEYLQWANARVNEEFGVNFEIETILETDMQQLDKYMPLKGRLLLCYAEEHIAGIACLKYLAPGIGEIKRMYVRPGNRKRGLGRTLINQLVAEAAQIGYELVRLDSARFMKEAHHLNQMMGFVEIDAYEGSEIPNEFREHWIFMEMELLGKKGKDSHTAG